MSTPRARLISATSRSNGRTRAAAARPRRRCRRPASSSARRPAPTTMNGIPRRAGSTSSTSTPASRIQASDGETRIIGAGRGHPGRGHARQGPFLEGHRRQDAPFHLRADRVGVTHEHPDPARPHQRSRRAGQARPAGRQLRQHAGRGDPARRARAAGSGTRPARNMSTSCWAPARCSSAMPIPR